MPAFTATGRRVPGAGLQGLPSSGSKRALNEVSENTSCLYKMTCFPRLLPEAPSRAVWAPCWIVGGHQAQGPQEALRSREVWGFSYKQ